MSKLLARVGQEGGQRRHGRRSGRHELARKRGEPGPQHRKQPPKPKGLAPSPGSCPPSERPGAGREGPQGTAEESAGPGRILYGLSSCG